MIKSFQFNQNDRVSISGNELHQIGCFGYYLQTKNEY